MPLATVDLHEAAIRRANRAQNRAEAIVQSDLRMLPLASGLNLLEENLNEVILEGPVGNSRRIEVEVGATVFEVTRDLRIGNIREDAVTQLAGYVKDHNHQTGARYVGVLTDGAAHTLTIKAEAASGSTNNDLFFSAGTTIDPKIKVLLQTPGKVTVNGTSSLDTSIQAGAFAASGTVNFG